MASSNQQLTIQVNPQSGDIQFSVSINDAIDPSRVAKMIQAVCKEYSSKPTDSSSKPPQVEQQQLQQQQQQRQQQQQQQQQQQPTNSSPLDHSTNSSTDSEAAHSSNESTRHTPTENSSSTNIEYTPAFKKKSVKIKSKPTHIPTFSPDRNQTHVNDDPDLYDLSSPARYSKDLDATNTNVNEGITKLATRTNKYVSDEENDQQRQHNEHRNRSDTFEDDENSNSNLTNFTPVRTKSPSAAYTKKPSSKHLKSSSSPRHTNNASRQSVLTDDDIQDINVSPDVDRDLDEEEEYTQYADHQVDDIRAVASSSSTPVGGKHKASVSSRGRGRRNHNQQLKTSLLSLTNDNSQIQVMSPVVVHPKRNRSVKQLAADIESRTPPIEELPMSPKVDDDDEVTEFMTPVQARDDINISTINSSRNDADTFGSNEESRNTNMNMDEDELAAQHSEKSFYGMAKEFSSAPALNSALRGAVSEDDDEGDDEDDPHGTAYPVKQRSGHSNIMLSSAYMKGASEDSDGDNANDDRYMKRGKGRLVTGMVVGVNGNNNSSNSNKKNGKQKTGNLNIGDRSKLNGNMNMYCVETKPFTSFNTLSPGKPTRTQSLPLRSKLEDVEELQIGNSTGGGSGVAASSANVNTHTDHSNGEDLVVGLPEPKDRSRKRRQHHKDKEHQHQLRSLSASNADADLSKSSKSLRDLNENMLNLSQLMNANATTDISQMVGNEHDRERGRGLEHDQRDDITTPSSSSAFVLTGGMVPGNGNNNPLEHISPFSHDHRNFTSSRNRSRNGSGSGSGSNNNNNSNRNGNNDNDDDVNVSVNSRQERWIDNNNNNDVEFEDSYHQGNSIISDEQSCRPAQIRAPTATKMTRWNFLTAVSMKMNGGSLAPAVPNPYHSSNLNGTNNRYAEFTSQRRLRHRKGDIDAIHQGTYVEGDRVIVGPSKKGAGASSKLSRGLLSATTWFGRSAIRSGEAWLEFSSSVEIEEMLAHVGKFARSSGFLVWRRPGENKLRCIRRLSHRQEMHMIIVASIIGLPDGPVTVVRLRRGKTDRGRTDGWRYVHFYRELVLKLKRLNIEVTTSDYSDINS